MSEVEIRELVARYIRNEGMPPQELEDRLEDEAWELDSEPLRAFVATVLRLLAEYGNGDWTDSDLRARLGELNRNYWFERAPKIVITGSGSSVITTQAVPGQVEAGTSREAVSA